MAVVPGGIQGPPPQGGKNVDTAELTTAHGAVNRQVVGIASSDAATPSAYAVVTAAEPASTDYGLAVRIVSLLLEQGADGASAKGALVQALVNDSVRSYLDDEVRPLSVNSEGRLRVSSVVAPTDLDFFPAGLDVTSKRSLWETGDSGPWSY